jgi:hypothetical protein
VYSEKLLASANKTHFQDDTVVMESNPTSLIACNCKCYKLSVSSFQEELAYLSFKICVGQYGIISCKDLITNWECLSGITSISE